MTNKEPYNGEISPENLREVLWTDDFTKMPVRDPSEYNEQESELFKTVEKYIRENWNGIAKSLGQTYAPSSFSEDHPAEALRKRVTAIVADAVIKLCFDENQFRKIIETFIAPRVENGSTGVEELHNVLNLAMQTMQVGDIVKIARQNSTEEDFSKKESRAKLDHNKRFYHSRSKKEVIYNSELVDAEGNGTTVDEAAEKMFRNIDSDLAVDQICKGLSERDAIIFRGLFDGRPQEAIADELGVSQSYISKLITKLSKRLSNMDI